jgi:hypothetical protein
LASLGRRARPYRQISSIDVGLNQANIAAHNMASSRSRRPDSTEVGQSSLSDTGTIRPSDVHRPKYVYPERVSLSPHASARGPRGLSEARSRLSAFIIVGLLVLLVAASHAGRQYRQPGCVTYEWKGLGETHIVCDDGTTYTLRHGDKGVGPRFEMFRPPSSGSRQEYYHPKDKRRSR